MTEKKPARSRVELARKVAPKTVETVEEGDAKPSTPWEVFFQNGPDAEFAYHIGTFASRDRAQQEAELHRKVLATDPRAEAWVGAENAPVWKDVVRHDHDATGAVTREYTVDVPASKDVRPYV